MRRSRDMALRCSHCRSHHTPLLPVGIIMIIMIIMIIASMVTVRGVRLIMDRVWEVEVRFMDRGLCRMVSV